MNMLAVAFLAAVAVGGIAYVFLYPLISGERQAEKRRESVARAEPAVRATRGQQRSRRDMVEASLKELEEKTKQQKPSLTVRIAQAGLTWSKRQFILISAAIGFALFMVALTIGPGLVPAIAILFREIFIAGLREFMGNRSISVPVTFLAKWKTTVQLIALFFVILAGLWVGTWIIAELLLWLAGILTVWTGWQYFMSVWPYFSAKTE